MFIARQTSIHISYTIYSSCIKINILYIYIYIYIRTYYTYIHMYIRVMLQRISYEGKIHCPKYWILIITVVWKSCHFNRSGLHKFKFQFSWKAPLHTLKSITTLSWKTSRKILYTKLYSWHQWIIAPSSWQILESQITYICTAWEMGIDKENG